MSRRNRSRRSSGGSRDSGKSSSSAISQLPSERLNAEHDVGGFTSGVSELDDWLRRIALNSDTAGNTRTWVWAPDGIGVIAYYSLCPTLVTRSELPKKLARGSLTRTPSILVARLAMIESIQGRGFGSALLSDSLTRAMKAIEFAGGRFIVVDAVDDRAVAFYEHHGFFRSPNNRRRLFVKANRIEASS